MSDVNRLNRDLNKAKVILKSQDEVARKQKKSDYYMSESTKLADQLITEAPELLDKAIATCKEVDAKSLTLLGNLLARVLPTDPLAESLINVPEVVAQPTVTQKMEKLVELTGLGKVMLRTSKQYMDLLIALQQATEVQDLARKVFELEQREVNREKGMYQGGHIAIHKESAIVNAV